MWKLTSKVADYSIHCLVGKTAITSMETLIAFVAPKTINNCLFRHLKQSLIMFSQSLYVYSGFNNRSCTEGPATSAVGLVAHCRDTA